ncbi:MAG: hypothetical protein CVU39_04120 [Chloroflexi bacterium HGW-Chloroflexi-10]|nr:MAG: hypothetical protein CVU39_04120 [Chloroflexi bacterium HGW-Chloroflexi-10]
MKKISMVILIAFVLAIVLPSSAYASPSGYVAGFQVQNLDTATDAEISIVFYNQDGSIAASPTDTIPAGEGKTYFPLTAVTDGFDGSVVISSNVEIKAIANVLTSDYAGGASYGGFSSGATAINLPLVMKNSYTISTWFNIQNTESTTANVAVTYSGSSCTEDIDVPAYSSVTLDQRTNSCLANGYVGAASLTADKEIVATVMQVKDNSKQLLAYNGFSSAATNPVMPLVSSNVYNSGTGIQVQNTGGSSTQVTITYTPSAGYPGAACTETKTIAAGQSQTFGFPQLPATCGTTGVGVTDATNRGFVGSAKVTTNSTSQPLVAIVNQINRLTAQGAAYSAFNDSEASSSVSLPLIMDRNYDIFTGFSVVNMGTSTTDVSCTFTGTSYTVDATLDPGEALTDVQLNKISNGYVGGATCVATGGDALIAGMVNEVTSGVPSTSDPLLVYEGFNY